MAKSDGKSEVKPSESGNIECGVIMPISEIDGCDKSHWNDVYDIIIEAASSSGFDARMFSESNEVGLIHKNIVQHLQFDPIVVCDVSAKNPNVMFELGLRLAFDKATVIIKDDKTSYSFDTAGIEHISYPRDLRYAKMIEFKQILSLKIRSTYEASQSSDYSMFVKHFGPFKIATSGQVEAPAQDLILEELSSLRKDVSRIRNSFTHQVRQSEPRRGYVSIVFVCDKTIDWQLVESFIDIYPGVPSCALVQKSENRAVFSMNFQNLSSDEIKRRLDLLFSELSKNFIGLRVDSFIVT